MPAYVIYARKSTESEDRQVLSIDSQINELRAIAMRRGIRVGDVLTESRSAKAPGRPIFSELMRQVNKGSIAGVLCWKMDRLARNHLDTGHVLQALADGKITEVITSDRTYTRDGNDRFMGSFELGMATKYIDDLRANVRRGNRARFERGWVNHSPPLGYLMDPVAKTIIKDPKRFDVVRRMWDLLLDGAHRPGDILKIANEQWQFRTRKFKRMGDKPLSRSVLYAIFGNVFYTGLIRLRDGRTFPGAHPAMVSQEQFDRAQSLLGRPNRSRPQDHEFAFTGLMRCGNCGGGITAEEHIKPSGRRYVYYRCSRRKAGVTCREPAISEGELERQLAERLRVLEIPEKVLNWIRRRVERTFAADQARVQGVREQLIRSLGGLQREQDNLLSLRLKDLLNDATFEARRRRIEDERRRIEGRLSAGGTTAAETTKLTLDTFSFAANAADRFVDGSSVQKRMILEAAGLNYELKSQTVRWELKQPLQIISDAGGYFNWSSCPDDVRTWIEDRTEDFRIPDAIMPQALPSTP